MTNLKATVVLYICNNLNQNRQSHLSIDNLAGLVSLIKLQSDQLKMLPSFYQLTNKDNNLLTALTDTFIVL